MGVKNKLGRSAAGSKGNTRYLNSNTTRNVRHYQEVTGWGCDLGESEKEPTFTTRGLGMSRRWYLGSREPRVIL